MKHLIVSVTGNIIIETSGHAFTHDLASCGGPEIIEIKKTVNPGVFKDNYFVIDGDLVLDDKTAVLPYASYIAQKHIKVSATCKPSKNVNSWRERNQDIRDKANIAVPSGCESYYHNGLFLSLCSSLELALMDILLIKITADPICYSNAVKLLVKPIWSK